MNSWSEWRVVDAAGIKGFGRIVQCASRVGDEFSLEALDGGLVIRALNPPRSICAEFKLAPSFFEAYNHRGGSRSATVRAKSLLPVFKQPSALKLLVMRMDDDKKRLVVESTSWRSVRKQFLVPFEDAQVVRAVFSRDSCPSRFTTRPKFLIDALANFHARLDEISMFVSPKSLRFASFFDDPDSVKNAMLRTEMTLEAREFEEFWVKPEKPSDGGYMELTFNCRSLRAVLDFCEPLFEDATEICFDRPGFPVLVTNSIIANGSPVINVSFVFATRQPPDDDDNDGDNSQSGIRPRETSFLDSHTRTTRTKSVSTVPSSTRIPMDGAFNQSMEQPVQPSQPGDDEFVEATPPPTP